MQKCAQQKINWDVMCKLRCIQEAQRTRKSEVCVFFLGGMGWHTSLDLLKCTVLSNDALM